ncbi:PEGA domain-containing protein [Methanoregula sp.]|uniref:PEGA domain-containing protein n=1 Tax=Methanoregula sp. TaxID=2052170 RepID=UPI00237625A2|nr:PEGA domain-containing protein [Methanoregula sp.]MDD1686982.1 PEGA domain-containing protein [Methanoregula sp.]
MRKSCAILIVILVVCALSIAVAAPVAADGDTPVGAVTTEPPVTAPPTAEPTTERTTVPTTEPTREPTVTVATLVTPETTVTVPTVVTHETTVTVPTVVTQKTTATVPPVVTTEPTITIVTIEPTEVGGGKGYIDTYCNVDGASVSFDGSYQCTIAQGVCTVGVSPTGTPIRTVSVTKTGYIPWSGPLGSMPENGQHVAVYATLNPVTTAPTTAPTITITPTPIQTGTIYAQSSPVGALIYLNGNSYGYSPVTIPNLAPGSYTMKASLNGYSPNTQIVTVYAGQTSSYYPVLQASPPSPHSTGTVYVTSNPTNALVYVDENYQGKAPLTVTLYPGSHTFRLSLTGYSDYTTTLYVNGNTNQNLNAVMTTAIYGTAAITSMPGANVYMDSASQGKIPSSGTLTLHNVVSGNRLFKVTASGYNDWLNTIYIQPNVVTQINAALTPIGVNPTPVPATGALDVVSTPAGAEIYVDNLFKGYTPSTLTGIAPGDHQVLLKYTGYVDYSQTATVNSGQTTPLAISMQPAPTPTPASAPSLAILIAGLVAAAGIGAVLRRRS